MNQINGLTLLENFITEQEENELIGYINSNQWDNKIKRRVQHYGHVFDYQIKKVDSQKHIPIPQWMDNMLLKLNKINLLSGFVPNQCTINEYLPGIGIAPHIDTHSSFTDTIISISLLSNIKICFKNEKEKIEILLPRRSLLILKDDARYSYCHGISYRKTDNINGLVIKREKRISITLRKILECGCKCKWSNLCDSQEGNLENLRL